MKRLDSKNKLVPIIPKKAEIIFALPSLSAQNTYYFPQPHISDGLQPLPGVNMAMARSSSGTFRSPQNNLNNNINGSLLGNSQSQPSIQPNSDKYISSSSKNQKRPILASSQSKPLMGTQQVPKENYQQQSLPSKNQNGAFINLERDNYAQDIARRKVLMIDLHSNLSTVDFIKEINGLATKPPKKKTRRHKTKFHISKSSKNIDKLQGVICNFISDTKKFSGSDQNSAPVSEKNAVFAQSTLAFADQLIEDKQHFKEKFGLDESNLRRNKCVLEHVVLNRMEKRVRNREKNSQLKKIKQQIELNGQGEYDGATNISQDSDDIVARLERPADRQAIVLALPKIQEAKEDEY